MFNLTAADLNQHILGCGDGPASFNAEATDRGHKIVSLDPIYQFSAAHIRQRIADNLEDVINQTRANADKFIWDEFGSVEGLAQIRLATMDRFLDDFDKGKRQLRYVPGELPTLPFDDQAFDLALCAHFLFLYTDNLSLKFHLKSVVELCRVSHEVRIFPLLDANANRSTYLDPVIRYTKSLGLKAEEETVPYEFQKGGNKMLRIIS